MMSPEDDDRIEMEEIEGLVNVNNAAKLRASTSSQLRSLSSSTSSSSQSKNRSKLSLNNSKPSGGKRVFVFLIILCAFMAFISVWHEGVAEGGDGVTNDGDNDSADSIFAGAKETLEHHEGIAKGDNGNGGDNDNDNDNDEDLDDVDESKSDGTKETDVDYDNVLNGTNATDVDYDDDSLYNSTNSSDSADDDYDDDSLYNNTNSSDSADDDYDDDDETEDESAELDKNNDKDNDIDNPNDNAIVDDEPEKYAEWGHWKFYDGSKDIRPEGDYCAEFPNRDIPEDKFPENAWQADAVYVNHFLDEANNLISRAKEAIYSEYGHGKPLPASELVKRSKMFQLDMLDFSKGDKPPPAKSSTNGGWTTKKSFEGLVRRLLHAMMTNDTFTVVLGGHSAAAGHGNHFLQSYTMQFHMLMEPIFNRLGVTLITRNLAHGGLGTLQSSLGSRSIYGDQVDLLLWDSGMTENYAPAMDIFARQAILGGERVPVIWGGLPTVLKMLNEKAGVDVGFFGTGFAGVPLTLDEEQVETLPFAAQYLNCDRQRLDLCNSPDNRFRTKCWIDRDDVTPPVTQRDHAASQVSWHPGFRNHHLVGNVLAFTILDALEDAVSLWSEITVMQGHPLPDENWHVTDHYQQIRANVEALRLDPSERFCEEYGEKLPRRICYTALSARTEFTPRAHPEQNSLTMLLKPAPNGYLPHIEIEMLYEGPDVPNPAMQLPDGALDVRKIVGQRRLNSLHSSLTRRQEFINRMKSSELSFQKPKKKPDQHVSAANDEKHLRGEQRALKANNNIVPGLGWTVDSMPGFCDGTVHGVCKRLPDSDCLLSGHMDHRGGILGDSYSGWLVLSVPNVKHGIIILKLDGWKQPINPKTQDWTSENNGHDGNARLLKEPYDAVCPDFAFDYAVDGGGIVTLDRVEYFEKLKHIAHAEDLFVILDDENWEQNQQERSVELGIRFRGCARKNPIKLTHVYWA